MCGPAPFSAAAATEFSGRVYCGCHALYGPPETALSRNEPSAIDELVAGFYPARAFDPRIARSSNSSARTQWACSPCSPKPATSCRKTFVARVCANCRVFSRGSAESELVAWLAALVHNRVVDAIRYHLPQRRSTRRRHRRSTPTVLSRRSREPDPIPGGGGRRARDHKQARLLANLSDHDRDLLQARLVDELPWEAIANALASPSADAARFAFRRLQGRLMLQLARAGPAMLDAGG
jgi:DNA-directed RNA polymerase specialized sigma24 family protein